MHEMGLARTSMEELKFDVLNYCEQHCAVEVAEAMKKSYDKEILKNLSNHQRAQIRLLMSKANTVHNEALLEIQLVRY